MQCINAIRVFALNFRDLLVLALSALDEMSAIRCDEALVFSAMTNCIVSQVQYVTVARRGTQLHKRRTVTICNISSSETDIHQYVFTASPHQHFAREILGMRVQSSASLNVAFCYTATSLALQQSVFTCMHAQATESGCAWVVCCCSLSTSSCCASPMSDEVLTTYAVEALCCLRLSIHKLAPSSCGEDRPTQRRQSKGWQQRRYAHDRQCLRPFSWHRWRCNETGLPPCCCSCCNVLGCIWAAVQCFSCILQSCFVQCHIKHGTSRQLRSNLPHHAQHASNIAGDEQWHIEPQASTAGSMQDDLEVLIQ